MRLTRRLTWYDGRPLVTQVLGPRKLQCPLHGIPDARVYRSSDGYVHTYVPLCAIPPKLGDTDAN